MRVNSVYGNDAVADDDECYDFLHESYSNKTPQRSGESYYFIQRQQLQNSTCSILQESIVDLCFVQLVLLTSAFRFRRTTGG